MEASTVATPQAPAEPESSHDGVAEATRSTEELFQWSGYVHVGRGAEQCPHGTDGQCAEQDHFHAWVCLPNTFQARDIGDKARAARARKIRALRDKSSEQHDVLEVELEELRYTAYADLLDAHSRAEVEKRLVEIWREVRDSDERFEHYDQDREELQRLRSLPEDEREQEEVERLEADLLAYADAVNARIEHDQGRERERLEALPQEEVLELERRSRIDAIATEAYLHTYYTWATFIGTREPSTKSFPSKRKFDDPNELKNAAPEVVLALREKIRELEQRTSARSDAAGN